MNHNAYHVSFGRFLTNSPTMSTQHNPIIEEMKEMKEVMTVLNNDLRGGLWSRGYCTQNKHELFFHYLSHARFPFPFLSSLHFTTSLLPQHANSSTSGSRTKEKQLNRKHVGRIHPNLAQGHQPDPPPEGPGQVRRRDHLLDPRQQLAGPRWIHSPTRGCRRGRLALCHSNVLRPHRRHHLCAWVTKNLHFFFWISVSPSLSSNFI